MAAYAASFSFGRFLFVRNCIAKRPSFALASNPSQAFDFLQQFLGTDCKRGTLTGSRPRCAPAPMSGGHRRRGHVLWRAARAGRELRSKKRFHFGRIVEENLFPFRFVPLTCLTRKRNRVIRDAIAGGHVAGQSSLPSANQASRLFRGPCQRVVLPCNPLPPVVLQNETKPSCAKPIFRSSRACLNKPDRIQSRGARGSRFEHKGGREEQGSPG